MPRPKKAVQPKLSKEQIAQQMAMKAEADRFKGIIRDKLYPVLQESGSITDAQQFCEVLKTVIMSKCNAYWADKNISDLGLIDELVGDSDAKDVDIYRAALEAIADLSITDAQKLLQGMGGALDGYTRRVAGAQPLKEVDVTEIIVT